MNVLRLASRARLSLHRPTLGFLQRRPLAIDDRHCSYPGLWGCVRGTTSSTSEASDKSPQNDQPVRLLLDLEGTNAVKVAMGGALLLRFQTDTELDAEWSGKGDDKTSLVRFGALACCSRRLYQTLATAFMRASIP